MDFGLSETQELLRRSAREYLSTRAASPGSLAGTVPPTPDATWRKAAELGWTGVLAPEQYGGAGLSFADMALLIEEWGAWLGEGPLVESSVVAVAALTRYGSERVRQSLLPRIADGSATVTLAMYGPGGMLGGAGCVQATPARSGWRLEGEAWFANYADTAEAAVLVAGDTVTGRTLVFTADLRKAGGPSLVQMKTASETPSFALKFSGQEVRREALLGDSESSDEVVRLLVQTGAAARSVQMAGAARRVLDRTVEYVSGRKQFGRPVGSFQAVQHMCADMAAMLQGSRHAAYKAMWAIAEGRPAAREVALAKIGMNEALPRICSIAHQCHGALGFTADYGLHRYTRAAIAWRSEFGDTAYHTEALASSMGL